MANTIVSLFDKAADAKSVVSELKSAKFTDTNNYTQSDSGKISGLLSKANVPDEAARFYQEGVKGGGTLVTLRVEDNEIDRAMEIINRYNPVNIEERSTQLRAGGFTDFDTERGTVALPVIEEEIQIGKRQVERGGVRIYTNVTETPVEQTVNLREEHVHVERRPVDRPVAEGDMQAFREGTIEMTETAEEAIVGKQARVVEEVVVGKEVTEREQVVSDTVRRTDVDVEEINTTETQTRKATNK